DVYSDVIESGEDPFGHFLRIGEPEGRLPVQPVLSSIDLFDDAAQLVDALRHFRHKKHEVIVFQVLDPAELSFPFDDITSIEDLETNREVISDPRAFRKAYLEGLAAHQATLRAGCEEAQIDYVQANTQQPFDAMLGSYLARRMSS
ncbi:hypothetical protein HQ590_12130, partial [bacterium]|nr:hypothetical protein [bacterium]